MLKKTKPKTNINKFLRCRKDKKYLYLKQALGTGEITTTQFIKLAETTDKEIFDRFTKRKEAIEKKELSTQQKQTA